MGKGLPPKAIRFPDADRPGCQDNIFTTVIPARYVALLNVLVFIDYNHGV